MPTRKSNWSKHIEKYLGPHLGAVGERLGQMGAYAYETAERLPGALYDMGVGTLQAPHKFTEANVRLGQQRSLGPAFDSAMEATGALPGVGKAVSLVGAAGVPAFIRAYHGSPHDFDKFSMDHIGTGEGAQAFGHGLYFADREDVARGYRDAVTATAGEFGPRGIAGRLLDDLDGDVDKAIRELEFRKSNSDNPEFIANMNEAIKHLKDGTAKGHMYEVNINADPESFLDWDKMISEQPEGVRAALASVADAIPENRLANALMTTEATLREAVKEKLTGVEDGPASTLMGLVRNRLRGDDEAARKAFKEAGIPGIRYLDQGSRGAGEGSRNYVVFDDQLIDIVRKYAAPAFIASGASYGLLSDPLSQTQDPAFSE